MEFVWDGAGEVFVVTVKLVAKTKEWDVEGKVDSWGCTMAGTVGIIGRFSTIHSSTTDVCDEGMFLYKSEKGKTFSTNFTCLEV